MRSRLRSMLILLLSTIALASCAGNQSTAKASPADALQIVSVETAAPEVAKVASAGLAAQAATPTVVPINSPTPSRTHAPQVTITPNAPGIVGNLVYAKPPRQRGFTRPSAVVPSTLKIINQTDLSLLVTLQGVSNAAPINPGGSTEWQVVPGTYTYSVVAEFGGLAFLQDTVTVEKGEVVTITITKGVASQVIFSNQTNLDLVITLPKTGKTLNLAAGETAAALPLPPNTYDFTASALSAAPYQGNFTLAGGETLTVTLIGQEIFGNSSLTINNQTNFAIRFTVDGVSQSITVNANQRSEPTYLPPGDYTYTVCTQSAGVNCHKDNFTIRAGEDVEITIDSTVIPTASVRFRNQTSFALVITIDNVVRGLVLPAESVSAAIDLAPGTYTYSACDQQSGTVCGKGDFTVNATDNLEITLDRGVIGNATVRFKNQTPYALVIGIPGVTRGVTIPSGAVSDSINILPGDYTYQASSSSNDVAPFTGNFTVEQGKELTIELSLGDRARATLAVLNRTSCSLTFNLNGPSSFTFTVSPGERKEVNIADGAYSYTASACGASTGDSFSGSHEVEFFLR